MIINPTSFYGRSREVVKGMKTNSTDKSPSQTSPTSEFLKLFQSFKRGAAKEVLPEIAQEKIETPPSRTSELSAEKAKRKRMLPVERSTRETEQIAEERIERTFTPGDANQDGSVNSLDLEILRLNFGRAGNWEMGDFDGDGYVGGSDFTLLAVNMHSCT